MDKPLARFTDPDGEDETPPIPQGKFYLLALGVDEYDNHRDLECAVSDTDAFCDILTEKYGFTVDRISKDANSDQIFDSLRSYKSGHKKITNRDFLVVWLAGHGVLGDTNSEFFYFMPKNGNPAPRHGNWVNMEVFKDYFNDIPAHQILLVMDCCHSGAVFRGDSIDMSDSNFAHDLECMRWKGRQGLTSGRKIDVVLDKKVGGQSPFASALIGILKSFPGAVISAEDLNIYLKLWFKNNPKIKQRHLLLPLSDTGGFLHGGLAFINHQYYGGDKTLNDQWRRFFNDYNIEPEKLTAPASSELGLEPKPSLMGNREKLQKEDNSEKQSVVASLKSNDFFSERNAGAFRSGFELFGGGITLLFLTGLLVLLGWMLITKNQYYTSPEKVEKNPIIEEPVISSDLDAEEKQEIVIPKDVIPISDFDKIWAISTFPEKGNFVVLAQKENSYDYYLAKISDTSLIPWQTKIDFNFKNNWNSKSAWLVTSTGDTFICLGKSAGGHNTYEVQKYSPTGEFLWKADFAGKQSYCYDLAEAPDGGVYVGASRLDDREAGQFFGWLIRVSASGLILWDRQVGGGQYGSSLRTVTARSDGGVFSGLRTNPYSHLYELGKVEIYSHDSKGNLTWKKDVKLTDFSKDHVDRGHFLSGMCALPDQGTLVSINRETTYKLNALGRSSKLLEKPGVNFPIDCMKVGATGDLIFFNKIRRGSSLYNTNGLVLGQLETGGEVMNLTYIFPALNGDLTGMSLADDLTGYLFGNRNETESKGSIKITSKKPWVAKVNLNTGIQTIPEYFSVSDESLRESDFIKVDTE